MPMELDLNVHHHEPECCAKSLVSISKVTVMVLMLKTRKVFTQISVPYEKQIICHRTYYIPTRNAHPLTIHCNWPHKGGYLATQGDKHCLKIKLI